MAQGGKEKPRLEDLVRSFRKAGSDKIRNAKRKRVSPEFLLATEQRHMAISLFQLKSKEWLSNRVSVRMAWSDAIGAISRLPEGVARDTFRSLWRHADIWRKRQRGAAGLRFVDTRGKYKVLPAIVPTTRPLTFIEMNTVEQAEKRITETEELDQAKRSRKARVRAPMVGSPIFCVYSMTVHF